MKRKTYWIQVHHNRISDIDNVTVSSLEKDTLLVDVKDALSILQNNSETWTFGFINREVNKKIKVQ